MNTGPPQPHLLDAANNYGYALTSVIKMGDTEEQALEKIGKLLETPGKTVPALEEIRSELLKN